MDEKLQALHNEVAQTSGVIESAVTLIGGLATQVGDLSTKLSAALAANDPAAADAAAKELEALTARLASEKDKLASAIAANAPSQG